MSENRENGFSQEEDLDLISLIDEKKRELPCQVEQYLELDGQEYLVLLPIDATVDIFFGDPESEELIVINDETTIEKLFPSAEAVLAEKNLKLNRTPFVMTVEGELPVPTEEDILTLEIEDEEANPMEPPMEPEELQFLASFYDEDKEYSIYTPLAPLIFFGRLNQDGKAELLSDEEFDKVRPILEDQLFDSME